MKCIDCERSCNRNERPVCEPISGEDCGLTDKFDELEEEIKKVDSDGMTNMTIGLHAAIDLMECKWRDEHEGETVFHCIIFLSDGADTIEPYFDCDDPNGPVQRARDLDIAIYAISLGYVPPDGKEALMCMANSTERGKFYEVEVVDGLKDAYEKIFEELDPTTPYYVNVEEVTESYIEIVPNSIKVMDKDHNVVPWPPLCPNVVLLPPPIDSDLHKVVVKNIGLVNDCDPYFSADETVYIEFNAKSNQCSEIDPGGNLLPLDWIISERQRLITVTLRETTLAQYQFRRSIFMLIVLMVLYLRWI
jgi:hypothetical protein